MAKKQKKINMESLSVGELEKQIQHHNKLYFEKNAPITSDYLFDLLVKALKKLKPDSSVLLEIGSDLDSARKKIEHSSPMLSLDKCYELEDLLSWAEKFEGKVAVSPKIDGAAIAIRYDKSGKLHLSETRGNGLKGDEITKNIRQIKDIPNLFVLVFF